MAARVTCSGCSRAFMAYDASKALCGICDPRMPEINWAEVAPAQTRADHIRHARVMAEGVSS